MAVEKSQSNDKRLKKNNIFNYQASCIYNIHTVAATFVGL